MNRPHRKLPRILRGLDWRALSATGIGTRDRPVQERSNVQRFSGRNDSYGGDEADGFADSAVMQLIRDHGLSAYGLGRSDHPLLLECPPAHVSLCGPDDALVAALGTGASLGWDLRFASSNATLSGKTGSGKTTLLLRLLEQSVRRGIGFTLLDEQGRLRDLLSAPGMRGLCRVIPALQLQISLFQRSSPNVPRDAVVSSTLDKISRCGGRIYAQRYFREHVQRELQQVPEDEGLPLSQLLAIARAGIGRSDRSRAMEEGMAAWLADIQSHLPGVFEYRQTNCLEKLYAEPAINIIELPPVPAEISMMLAVLLQEYLALQRSHSPLRQHPTWVFVHEDGASRIDKQWDRYGLSGTSPLIEQMLTNRKLGLGTFLVTQSLSSASEKLLGNVEACFVTSVQGEDPHLLEGRFGMKRELLEAARWMRPGELLALIPSKWPAWLHGSFEPLNLTPVDDQTCEASCRALLASLKSKPARANQDGAAQKTSQDVRSGRIAPDRLGYQADDFTYANLMAFIPLLARPLMLIYRQRGWTRQHGASLTGKFQRQGWISVRRYPTGTRGGAIAVAQPTEEAWTLLEEAGLAQRPEKLTHGGEEHNMAARLVLELGRQRGFRVAVEVDLGNVRPDMYWSKGDGGDNAAFFQIGVSDPHREADALMRIWTLPASRRARIVLVAADQAFFEKVRQILRAQNMSELLEKLELWLVGQLLKWVWDGSDAGGGARQDPAATR